MFEACCVALFVPVFALFMLIEKRCFFIVMNLYSLSLLKNKTVKIKIRDERFPLRPRQDGHFSPYHVQNFQTDIVSLDSCRLSDKVWLRLLQKYEGHARYESSIFGPHEISQ